MDRCQAPAHCQRPCVGQAVLRRTDAISLAALVGPREMAVARPLALPSCVPSLHGHYPLLRYYGCSDPDRTLCRPLPWFPDSRHQNFPPFCLLSSAVLDQTRSTPSTLAALFRSGFAVRSQARQNRRPNRVHFVRPYGRTLLWTGGSLPVALHPGVSPRCSYFQLLALQCRPGQGLSPCCSSALSGAQARQLDSNEAARRFGLALSPANAPAQAAAWVDGFLRNSGLLLLHDETLWRVLDEWVTALKPDYFTNVLPLLRRTFSTFAPAERRQIGGRVAGGATRSAALPATSDEFDEARANSALPLLAQILGLKAPQ